MLLFQSGWLRAFPTSRRPWKKFQTCRGCTWSLFLVSMSASRLIAAFILRITDTSPQNKVSTKTNKMHYNAGWICYLGINNLQHPCLVLRLCREVICPTRWECLSESCRTNITNQYNVLLRFTLTAESPLHLLDQLLGRNIYKVGHGGNRSLTSADHLCIAVTKKKWYSLPTYRSRVVACPPGPPPPPTPPPHPPPRLRF